MQRMHSQAPPGDLAPRTWSRNVLQPATSMAAIRSSNGRSCSFCTIRTCTGGQEVDGRATVRTGGVGAKEAAAAALLAPFLLCRTALLCASRAALHYRGCRTPLLAWLAFLLYTWGTRIWGVCKGGGGGKEAREGGQTSDTCASASAAAAGSAGGANPEPGHSSRFQGLFQHPSAHAGAAHRAAGRTATKHMSASHDHAPPDLWIAPAAKVMSRAAMRGCNRWGQEHSWLRHIERVHESTRRADCSDPTFWLITRALLARKTHAWHTAPTAPRLVHRATL